MNKFSNIISILLNRFRHHLLPLLIFAIITSIITRKYIYSDIYPAGTDIFGWIARVEFFTNNVWVWWDPSSFGLPRFSTLQNILSTVNNFIHDSVFIVKIVVILSIFLAMVNMYLLLYHILKKSLPALVSAVTYTINPFFTGKLCIGHIDQTLAYAFIPLYFLFLDKSIQSNNNKERGIIITFTSLIVAFIINFTRMDMFYYIGFFTFLYIFIVITVRPYVLRNVVISIVYIMGLSIGLSLFQFIPILFGSHPSYLSPSEIVAPIEHLKEWTLNLFYIILGFSREIGYKAFLGGETWFYHPFLPKLSQYILHILMPVTLAYNIMIIKIYKNRYYRVVWTITVAIFSIVAIFLAKGPNEPFGNMYLIALRTVPFFGLIREPIRWSMFIWFSYAISVGLFIENVGSKYSYPRPKIIRRSVVVLLTIIFLIVPIILNPFVIFNGLHVWRPPSVEIAPHIWLKENDKSLYRVATVPYGQPHMYTGTLRGITKGWWEQDLGATSYYYHHRSVVGTGGWYWGDAADFVRYTIDVIKENKSLMLSKVLGIYNVKYIVLQGYPPSYPNLLRGINNKWYQHQFFKTQLGIEPVFEFDNVSIYKNEFYLPRIFVASKLMTIIGGLDATLALANIKEFDFRDWNIVFLDTIIKDLDKFMIERLLNKSDIILFYDSTIDDLIFLVIDKYIPDNYLIKIPAFLYGKPSVNISKYWIRDDTLFTKGILVYNRYTLSTESNSSVELHFKINDAGSYYIFIRLFSDKKRATLNLYLDGTLLAQFNVSDYPPRMKWLNISVSNINPGLHSLIIENVINRNNRRNDIDEIIIVKKEYYRKFIERFVDYIDAIKDKFVFVVSKNEFQNRELLIISKLINVTQWKVIEPNNINITVSPNYLELFSNNSRQYYTIVQARPSISNLNNISCLVLELWANKSLIDDLSLLLLFNHSYYNWIRYDLNKHEYDPKKGLIVIDRQKFDAINNTVTFNDLWLIRILYNNKNASIRSLRIGNLYTCNFIYKYVLHIPSYSNEYYVYLGFMNSTMVRLTNVTQEENKIVVYIDTYKYKYANFIYIMSQNAFENMLGKNTINKETKYEFKIINPAKYIVYINTTHPVYIILSESYHPMWHAYILKADGSVLKELYHLKAYWFINAFVIEQPGNYIIILEYMGDHLFRIGLLASIIVFLFNILFVIRMEYFLKLIPYIFDYLKLVINRCKQYNHR